MVADDQSSATRAIALGDGSKGAMKSLGQWLAWFKVPRTESDDRWASWYSAPGRRVISTRPDSKNKNDFVRAILAIIGHDDELRSTLQSSTADQKSLWRKLFTGIGWQETRILKAMDEADDFYMQEVVQVKMDEWYRGRVVLTGDAAYCAAPLSGLGTTLAITGPYVLAGEIAKQPRDLLAAFQAYDDKMRPFVLKGQKLPPGVPWIANPETSWGISIFYSILNFLSWSGLIDIMQKAGYGTPLATAMDLPDYGIS